MPATLMSKTGSAGSAHQNRFTNPMLTLEKIEEPEEAKVCVVSAGGSSGSNPQNKDDKCIRESSSHSSV